MAENVPDWAKSEGAGPETSDTPDWVLSTPQEKSKPMMLDQAVKGARGEAVTGAKRGLIGGLGTLGDISSLMSRLFGVDPKLAEKFRGFPTSEEVGKKLEPVIGKAEGPSSDVTEFLANPLSYLGPGGLVRKLGGALAGGVGAETGKAVAGTPGEIIGGLVGGGIPVPGRRVTKTPTQRAASELTEKFSADQASPQQTSQIQQARPNVAKPFDIGGPSIAGVVERLGQTSGAGRQIMEPALIERQQGSLSRISDDLSTLTDSKRTALQATEQTMKERSIAAAPAYKQAYAAGDREIWSNNIDSPNSLERLSGSPDVQIAMRAALRKWQTRAIADGYGAMNPTQIDRGGLIKFGKSVPVFPNMQFWDYTKGALDKLIDGEIRPNGSMTRHGQALVEIKNQLLGELDRIVPEYGAARQQWAGPTSYLNALEEGRSILTRSESAEVMATKFNALPEADKQGYREAAISSILAKMESNPAKLADLTRELRSPAMQKKITAIMPTQQAKDMWNKRLDFEIKSSELVGLGLKGSPTARRLAEMQEAENLVGDLVLGSFLGHPRSSVYTALRGGARKVLDKIRAETDKEMAKFLTEGKFSPPQAPKPRPAITSPYGERNIRNLLITLGGQRAGNGQNN